MPEKITPAEFGKIADTVRNTHLSGDKAIMRDIDGDHARPIVSTVLCLLHEMGLVDIRDALKAFGGGELIPPGPRIVSGG